MSNINKMIVLFFGVAGGMLMGALLGMVLVLLVHPLVPKGPWVIPAFFTLFFVPLFPVSRRYHLTCGGCGLEREVSGFDADDIQQGRHQ